MNILLDIFSFLLGASVSSFLGVVIDRVPKKKSIVSPPSCCDSCGKRIKWYDNIPILSYLILKGKCRYCKSRIPISSLILELLGGLLYLSSSLLFPFSYHLAFYYPIVSIVLLISFVDYYHHYIFDFSQVLLAVFVLGDTLTESILEKAIPIPSFIGLAIAFLFFLTLKIIGRIVWKRDVLGTGDVILISIFSFHIGYKALLLLLLVSSLTGSIIEGIRTRKDKEKEIAFAPYLCFGYLFSLFLYPTIERFVMEVI